MKVTMLSSIRSKPVSHYKTGCNGQTIVETALLMPFFLFLIFAVFYFTLFIMENHVTRYAAFMAARSYQVFGNQVTDKGNKIYEDVANSILEQAIPYLPRRDFVIAPDSLLLNTAPELLHEDDWQGAMALYGVGANIASPSDQVSYLKDDFNPRYGVMLLSFTHESPLPFSDIYFSQKVFVPYRLERLVQADMAIDGADYIFK